MGSCADAVFTGGRMSDAMLVAQFRTRIEGGVLREVGAAELLRLFASWGGRLCRRASSC